MSFSRTIPFSYRTHSNSSYSYCYSNRPTARPHPQHSPTPYNWTLNSHSNCHYHSNDHANQSDPSMHPMWSTLTRFRNSHKCSRAVTRGCRRSGCRLIKASRGRDLRRRVARRRLLWRGCRRRAWACRLGCHLLRRKYYIDI